MYNIAFFHNKLGKTDGVSLEINKWKRVLEEMGHNVYFCAGNNDEEIVDFVIPQLSFLEPLTNKILKNGTVEFIDYNNEKQLEKDIFYQSGIIKKRILKFINKYNIDIIIPNNLLSVGYNIPAMVALSEIIKETKIPTINHNHDFYFEESGEVNITCQTVMKIFEKYSVPDTENVVNIVINKIAQKELKSRKNIVARVISNVFEFKDKTWEKDDYNQDFRKEIGITKKDIVFLQATRVLDRKAIELAIDIVAEMNKTENIKRLLGKKLYNNKIFSSRNKIVLVCSGYVEKFGITGDYYNNLHKRADELGVDIKFVGDIVQHERGYKDGKKIYSLWDSYVHADFVTYPSMWEGFGNQLLEAIYAKLPVVIFEYPVYKTDLKDKGLNLVSLGDKITGKDENGLVCISDQKLKEAAREISLLLLDRNERKGIVEKNYQIARENFSFSVLEEKIEELLDCLKLM